MSLTWPVFSLAIEEPGRQLQVAGANPRVGSCMDLEGCWKQPRTGACAVSRLMSAGVPSTALQPGVLPLWGSHMEHKLCV